MKIIFYERFVELCELHNTKPSPVLKKLGISSGNIKRWKSGASANRETIEAVANYFNVPLEYFSSDYKVNGVEPQQVNKFVKIILEEIEQCKDIQKRLEKLYQELYNSTV